MASQNSLDSWEETTYASDIYNEMLAFRDLTRNFGKERKLHAHYQAIEKYIEKGDFNLAMLFMNELELNVGIKNTRYPQYEAILAPVYRKEMLRVNRPACHLINLDMPESLLHIRDFKNRHKGERCFILGNGPSLNKLDLTLLKNEVTFGVNSIFLNFGKMGFEVTYYAVEDSHVIRERARQVGELRNPVRFIPHYAAKQIPWSPQNIYLNVVGDYTRYSGFPYFSTDAARRVWVGGTVIYINMQLAYYMGFDEVYLIGFDHSYTIPQSAEVSGANIKSTEDDPNHFHPDYFGKGFHWHIPLTERMELCYRKTEYAFSQAGRKVYNATAGGKLEVFERRNYNELFGSIIHPVSSGRTEQDSPDISIIIPTHNRANLIARAVDSALYQYGIHPEVIVVNDGSTDSTDAICHDYAREYTNFKYISQDNKGCGGARNSGLKIATAPYVTFLDSDDTLDPDFLYLALVRMSESGADILNFDYKRLVNGKNIRKPRDVYMLDTGLASFKGLIETTMSATERIYKRDFLLQNNIWFLENCIHEDLHFSVQTHYYASKIDFLAVQGYNCFEVDVSITAKMTERNLESLAFQLGEIKNFLIGKGVFGQLFRLYYALCFRLVRDVILRRVNVEPDIVERTMMLRKVRKMMREMGLLHYEVTNLLKTYSKALVNEVLAGMFATALPPARQAKPDSLNRLVFGSKSASA